jgi:CrcB protein
MVTWKTLCAVAGGGALGAVGRYLLYVILHRDGELTFPWHTFAANLLGCLIIGILTAALLNRLDADSPARLFWITGVLGALTTFSTFGLECVQMLEARRWNLLGSYLGLSVVAGLGLAWIGMTLGRKWL